MRFHQISCKCVFIDCSHPVKYTVDNSFDLCICVSRLLVIANSIFIYVTLFVDFIFSFLSLSSLYTTIVPKALFSSVSSFYEIPCNIIGCLSPLPLRRDFVSFSSPPFYHISIYTFFENLFFQFPLPYGVWQSLFQGSYGNQGSSTAFEAIPSCFQSSASKALRPKLIILWVTGQWISW